MIEQINHQLRLRLTSISFCMQRFGASLWMAIASAEPNDLLLLARYRILKAFCGSTLCRVSAKCFVIALFGTPVLFPILNYFHLLYVWSSLAHCNIYNLYKLIQTFILISMYSNWLDWTKYHALGILQFVCFVFQSIQFSQLALCWSSKHFIIL